MSNMVPKYTAWEAINAALAVGMRALEEIRTLKRIPVKGERGEAGPAGKLPIVRAWEDRVYYEGEVVSYDGGAYQASRDTGRPPLGDDWTCIVSAGRNGVDGRSPESLGLYKPDSEYKRLNMVALNGGQFIAKRDDPGQCPGEGWHLMASQGKQGKPGERGASGPKGDRGASVVGGTMSPEGVVTFRNSDGTQFDVDFYPALSRLG